MPESLGGAGDGDSLENVHRVEAFSMASGRNAGGVTMEAGGGRSVAFEGERACHGSRLPGCQVHRIS